MITQGKWEVDSISDVDQEGKSVYAVYCGKTRIASRIGYPGSISDNVSSANARLIAAAPDLLEACKEALKLIDIARKYFPKSIKNSDKFTLENTCATIGKAIAKAEGK